MLYEVITFFLSSSIFGCRRFIFAECRAIAVCERRLIGKTSARTHSVSRMIATPQFPVSAWNWESSQNSGQAMIVSQP